jgi:hypothetical protein
MPLSQGILLRQLHTIVVRHHHLNRGHIKVTQRSYKGHARSRKGHIKVTHRSHKGHAEVTYRSRTSYIKVTHRSHKGHAKVKVTIYKKKPENYVLHKDIVTKNLP